MKLSCTAGKERSAFPEGRAKGLNIRRLWGEGNEGTTRVERRRGLCGGNEVWACDSLSSGVACQCSDTMFGLANTYAASYQRGLI